METEPSRQDAETTRQFFDQWAFYRKIVDEDYLGHKAAMAAFARWLDARPGAFSFLDLGCGDAIFTSAVLAGREVSRYAAVDISPVALDLARKNTEILKCPRDFVCGDFSQEIRNRPQTTDLIYVGLSFHHLPHPAKGGFLEDVRRALAPGGTFVFFEPTRLEGESRDEYLTRWIADARKNWTKLNAEEMTAVEAHVTGSDYPETASDYEALGRAAGFVNITRIFGDPQSFYTTMAFS